MTRARISSDHQLHHVQAADERADNGHRARQTTAVQIPILTASLLRPAKPPLVDYSAAAAQLQWNRSAHVLLHAKLRLRPQSSLRQARGDGPARRHRPQPPPRGLTGRKMTATMSWLSARFHGLNKLRFAPLYQSAAHLLPIPAQRRALSVFVSCCSECRRLRRHRLRLRLVAQQHNWHPKALSPQQLHPTKYLILPHQHRSEPGEQAMRMLALRDDR
jgi:hypothetical protein